MPRSCSGSYRSSCVAGSARGHGPGRFCIRCVRLRCRSALVFQSAPQDAAHGVPVGLRRFAGATAPPPSLTPSGTHNTRRGCLQGLHTAARPSTCHTRRGVQAHTREIVRPTRGFQRPIRKKVRPTGSPRLLVREIVRPTRGLQRPIREKTRPARHKTPILGHFSLAGRTFSRSRPHQAAQGELFRARDTATWRRCNHRHHCSS